MGDPRKYRKTYARPKKTWDLARLEDERVLVTDYGIPSKTEIYKMRSLLRKYASQAKKLMSAVTPQAETERKALLAKLQSYGLVPENAQLDDVLALELKNILERRLQTIVLRKGLANTIKQARQMITHQHIRLGNKPISSPAYIVSKVEESAISFVDKSPFVNPEHPERPEMIFKMKNKKDIPKAPSETANVIDSLPAEQPGEVEEQ